MENNIKIIYEWEKVDYSKHDLTTPAVYKWIFDNKTEKIYVGETINIKKRIYQYLHPGPTQTTNKKIKKIIEDSSTADLYILKIINLIIDDFEIINEDKKAEEVLKDQFIRQFIENYFILKEKIIHKKELLNTVGRNKNNSLE